MECELPMLVFPLPLLLLLQIQADMYCTSRSIFEYA